jgi:hypothetical protein
MSAGRAVERGPESSLFVSHEKPGTNRHLLYLKKVKLL